MAAGAEWSVAMTADVAAARAFARLERTARVASLNLEAGLLRGVPDGARFGRPLHPITAGKALVRCAAGLSDAAGAAWAGMACRTHETVQEDTMEQFERS